MGLRDRLFGGKLPAWAKGSPHDARSAAALVEAIQRYVLDNGGTIELFEDSAKVCGPRGERTVKFADFVFICAADCTETWPKMIAHAVRDLIPDAMMMAEVRASLEGLLTGHAATLAELAEAPDRAQAHLRIALRVRGFHAEVPDLIRVVRRDALDRFEAIAVYDFLPQAEGLPASHLAAWDVGGPAILARAEQNTFAADALVNDDLISSIEGPFAGSRILAAGDLGDPGELGLLLSAPHQDLCLFHVVRDARVVDVLAEMVRATYQPRTTGPAGGTGRALYWWRKGVFQEIPTNTRTILREGADPYEYRLPDRFKRDVLKPLGIDA